MNEKTYSPFKTDCFKKKHDDVPAFLRWGICDLFLEGICASLGFQVVARLVQYISKYLLSTTFKNKRLYKCSIIKKIMW